MSGRTCELCRLLFDEQTSATIAVTINIGGTNMVSVLCDDHAAELDPHVDHARPIR